MTPTVRSGYVYLDYAATAPLVPEAAQAMAPYFACGADNLGVGMNANSLHAPGRAAFAALEQARRSLAADLGAHRPDEIVLTAGATESDCAALLGIAQAAADERRRRGAGPGFVPHVVTTAIEHDAVLEPARRLEALGFRVTRLAPDRLGFVSVDDVRRALDEQTVLVSVQAANSEVGTLQPVAEIARAAHEAGAYMHTDAVQALGKVRVHVGEWGVDAASFSAHKVGGPKGVGALYLKARTPFQPQMLGGGQEAGRRSGTQNVAGAVGFAAACREAVSRQQAEQARLGELRDRLYAAAGAWEGVRATVDVPAGSADFLPNVCSLLVRGLESETLVLRLDQRGLGVSGGSACASHSLEPSHVLLALGVDKTSAQGALRVSMGRFTRPEDVEALIAAMPEVLDWKNAKGR